MTSDERRYWDQAAAQAGQQVGNLLWSALKHWNKGVEPQVAASRGAQLGVLAVIGLGAIATAPVSLPAFVGALDVSGALGALVGWASSKN